MDTAGVVFRYRALHIRAVALGLSYAPRPRGGGDPEVTRHDPTRRVSCWDGDGPNPHHPLSAAPHPSRVAIRRSREKQRPQEEQARSRKRRRNCLNWTRPESKPRRTAPPPPLSLPSSPDSRPHAGAERAEASMHHDPNPFDEGSANDNPFSVSPQNHFPLPRKFWLPTSAVW